MLLFGGIFSKLILQSPKRAYTDPKEEEGGNRVEWNILWGDKKWGWRVLMLLCFILALFSADPLKNFFFRQFNLALFTNWPSWGGPGSFYTYIVLRPRARAQLFIIPSHKEHTLTSKYYMSTNITKIAFHPQNSQAGKHRNQPPSFLNF